MDVTGKAGRSRSRWKLIGGGAVLVLALVWLALFVTVGGDFYQTVEEIKQGGATQNVRVGGRVAPGSLEQDSGAVKFVLTGDSGAELAVVYRGTYPERLGPYEEVVAAGSTGSDGVFEATQVLIKCPSKLLPEKVLNETLSGAGLERVLY